MPPVLFPLEDYKGTEKYHSEILKTNTFYSDLPINNKKLRFHNSIVKNICIRRSNKCI